MSLSDSFGNEVREMTKNETSKFIALILRHKPETIGITLDEHGWANVEELVAGIAKQQAFDRDMLEEIVRTDSKMRYSFNEDHTLIRANQGHSRGCGAGGEDTTGYPVARHWRKVCILHQCAGPDPEIEAVCPFVRRL